jgi:hypothetical protein
MATYPQGVSNFIPDYQPYQPDFNFTANVLQLKQTQYDQNWQRLNNIYGQILNAPLTHGESVKRRDNTLKRIDFDLKRITGLDLSLEQNVQQATQLFRPFYEDKNLMKDMVFTKNAGFERALGEGKRISTDEKVNSEYWDGGLRAIDYKMQEFKETPYDQLTGFGDVRYTPYVNVEKEALDLAAKLKLNIKRTTPQGDWIVTEKNGEPAIPILQSIFYSALGKDPKVKDLYATQAYLERKDYVMSNKDNQEFGGNAELAEKKYLNNTLTMLQKQTDLIRTSLVSEKKVNDKMISRLEQSQIDGTDNASTSETLQRYRDANAKIEEMLNQNTADKKLITDNVNQTLTTKGGVKLSTDDINQLRAKVDAVTASTLLQADLDKAARDFAYINYEQTLEANPFAVMKQKYLYDSSLIKQRADAQKDVAYFKYLLDFDKTDKDSKLKSGLYYEDANGEVKMFDNLAYIQSDASVVGVTDSEDPNKLITSTQEMYTSDANATKGYILKTLNELNKEGVLSNRELYEVLIGTGKNKDAFNFKPVLNWLKENAGRENTQLDPESRNLLGQAGVYTTKLELDYGDGGNLESQMKLSNLSSLSLDDLTPDQITALSQRLKGVIEKKKDNPNIKNSSTISALVNSSYALEDYAAVKTAYRNAKIAMATEIKDKLKADGFNYSEFLFNEDLEFVATPEEFMQNVARWNPDHLVKDDAMTWGGFANTIFATGTAGGVLGTKIFPTLGTGVGFGAGVLAGTGAYITSGLMNMAWNAFNDGTSNFTLRLPTYKTTGGSRTVNQEYDAMMEAYKDLARNSDIITRIPALHHAPSTRNLSLSDKLKNFARITEKGTGYYTANGASITVQPGVYSPTYNHFLQLSSALKNIRLDDNSDADGYVTFKGPTGTAEGSFENRKIFQSIILTDLMSKADKKGSDLKQFSVSVTPFGGDDVSKAAVVFKLPEEYLKKFAPTKDVQKLPGLSAAAYQDILANGLTLITDARNLQDVAMFRNSFKTVEQIRIEEAGDKGVTYTDPRYPNYSINYKTDFQNSNTYRVTERMPVYNPDTRKMETVDIVKGIVNMGTNIASNRERFFNEVAPYNEQVENSERRKYERQ